MRKSHHPCNFYSLVIEVIIGVIIVICMVLELFIAFFAAIDFKSLEKAQ